MPAASWEVVIESLSTVIRVWSGPLCVVFLMCFAQSCPVCCHQVDLLVPSHAPNVQTGFLKPGLDSTEASTLF